MVVKKRDFTLFFFSNSIAERWTNEPMTTINGSKVHLKNYGRGMLRFISDCDRRNDTMPEVLLVFCIKSVIDIPPILRERDNIRWLIKND